MKDWENTRVRDFYDNLSIRTTNSLSQGGIITLGQADATPDRDLLMLPNFGRKSLNEIRAFIADISGKPIMSPETLMSERLRLHLRVDNLAKQLEQAKAALDKVGGPIGGAQ